MRGLPPSSFLSKIDYSELRKQGNQPKNLPFVVLLKNSEDAKFGILGYNKKS